MIRKQSDDPDVAAAAGQAAEVIGQVLASLPKAQEFDYGGHMLKLGEYDVCTRCTGSIAEAQAAHSALSERAKEEPDPVVKEHIELAAELFETEARAATIRAEFHNGHNSEKIVNSVLGFIADRNIHDSYDHSHHGGN